MTTSIGIIGLGAMGKNLALNVASKKIHDVHVYNRTFSKTQEFCKLAQNYKLEEYVKIHNDPLDVIMGSDTTIVMLPHGDAFDNLIDPLIHDIPNGYTLIDGANEHYKISQSRGYDLQKYGINYLGVGVSGGATGAREGPCMMIGGDQNSFQKYKYIFDMIANNATYCYYGDDYGIGHFIKTVHNGIEYAILQAICEIFHVFGKNTLLEAISLDSREDKLDGMIIDITKRALQEYDLDNIKDVAKMNDTGLWCVQYAHEHKICIPMINATVNARFISVYVEDKKKKSISFQIDSEDIVQIARNTLKFSYACAIYEGKLLCDHYGNIDYNDVMANWYKGAIISCDYIEPNFQRYMHDYYNSTRRFVSYALFGNLPASCIYSALSFYNSKRCGKLPVTLLMAQRNIFGEHPIEFV
jgi:6-phosphogluconate dehydrogenase